MQVSNRIVTLTIMAVAICVTTGCQTAKHKRIVLQTVDAINARDLDSLDRWFHPDYVRHSQATPGVVVESLDAFKAFLEQDFASIPDSHMHLDWVIAEGDMVAMYGTYAGTQTGQMGPFAPSGRRMNIDFAAVHRFKNGKFAESWITWDNLTALQQLGHIPTPGAGGN